MLVFTFQIKLSLEAFEDDPVSFGMLYLSSYGIVPDSLNVIGSSHKDDSFVKNTIIVGYRAEINKLK